ncbi:MAG: PAS domain S-box protein [Bacteroidota bacterium]
MRTTNNLLHQKAANYFPDPANIDSVSLNISNETASGNFINGVPDSNTVEITFKDSELSEIQVHNLKTESFTVNLDTDLLSVSELVPDILDIVADAVWILDPESNLVLFNKAYTELFYPNQALSPKTGDNMLDLAGNESPAMREMFAKVFSYVLSGGVFSETMEIKFPGKTMYIKTTYKPIIRSGKAVAISGTGRDMTTRVLQAKALAESEQRWRLALHANKNGVFDWDIVNNKTWYSPRLLEMLRAKEPFTPDFLPDLEGIFAKSAGFHPVELLHKYLKSEIPTFEFESLVAFENEPEHCFAGAGVAEWDADGKPLRMVGTLRDVTPMRQMRDKLAVSEQNLRAIIENTDDLVWSVNHELRLVIFNNPCRIWAESMNKGPLLAGQHISEIFRGELWEYWKPRFELALRGHTHTYSKLIEMSGGSLLFEVKLNPIRNEAGEVSGISVSGRNVSDQRRSEMMLRNSLEFNKSLFEKSSTGIAVIAKAGYIEDVNDSLCTIFGYNRYDVIKMSFTKLFPEKFTISLLRQFLDLMNYENPFKGEFSGLHKNGTELTVLLEGVRLVLPSGDLKGSVFVTDITERKNAEKALEVLTNNLQRRNEELQQFAYITSHNLRAPVVNLSSLISFYDPKQGDSDFNSGLIEKMAESTEKLDSTIIDLVTITNISNRRSETEVYLKFEDYADMAIRHLLPETEATGAVIKSDFSKAAGVVFPPDYLESIFRNLINNAIRFRNPELKPDIYLKTVKKEDYIILSVTDNGIGIDLSKHGHKMFGLYQRLSAASGKGFGLHLVRSQAEAMGGYTEVESQPGKGSTFRVFFKNKPA